MKPEIRENVSVSVEPLAVHVDVAARMIGISRRGFYLHFITPRRITPVYMGHRAMIDVTELRAAWQEYQSCPQARIPTRPVDPAAP